MVILAEDKMVIDGCIAGKRDAQYQLYKTYSKAMFNVCVRMINDVNEAEDILQNAFVDIFTKLKMFRYESTPGAWIKRIVVNHCINHIRAKKQLLLLSEQVPDIADDINEESVEPDGYRSVFCLYAMEGYDHSEIAEILDINESTSKSQYSRARGKVYEILKSNGSIEKIFQ